MTLGYNPVLLYLFGCSNCSSFATGNSFSWFRCSLDTPPSMVFVGLCFVGFCFVLVFFYLPVLQDAPGSSCIFSTPILESVVSSFYYRIIFKKNKIWVPSMLIATGVSFLLDPLSWQSKKLHVFIFDLWSIWSLYVLRYISPSTLLCQHHLLKNLFASHWFEMPPL